MCGGTRPRLTCLIHERREGRVLGGSWQTKASPKTPEGNTVSAYGSERADKPGMAIPTSLGYSAGMMPRWTLRTMVAASCLQMMLSINQTQGQQAAQVSSSTPESSGHTPPQAVLPGLNADPHIAVFGDTFYLYPTTDGSEGWRSTSFRAWSSRDLLQWKDEGVILDLPRDLKWAKLHAWAPAIATRNGKFYYYFTAAQNIGVAVADKPTGPFSDPLGKPLVAKADFPRMQTIDPMVFVDEDGGAFLYWGQGRCKAVKLQDDMISFEDSEVRDLTPPGYNEGPFVHKRAGKYYLSWSEFDTRDPRYSVAYGMGDSPLGPFKKAGANPILQQSGTVKGAGHHSIVKIPGRDEWVIAYHRFRIPGGNGYNRETCLSPLRHARDGSIQPVDVFESVALRD